MGAGEPSARDLLEQGVGLLTRSHLRQLGLPRAAIDAVFKKLDVVYINGYTRPLVKVEDYLRLIRESTYGRDRVRPTVTSFHRQTMGRPPR